MDVKLRDRLNRIVSLSLKQDWNDTSFSLHKAHICAELASIVYEDVQEYELKRASRIHLFASDTYRKIIKTGAVNSVLSSLREADLEAKFFTVRSTYAIVLGVLIQDALILVVRGTVFCNLWDWKANLDTRKYYVSSPSHYPREFHPGGFEEQFFHRGFFESVVPQFASISDEIDKIKNQKGCLKIIWTGHSLGGAMAAIGFAMHKSSISINDLPGYSKSAYTFGMPRYCGLGTVCRFASPFHIYRKGDIVPTVPLCKMGFSNSSREYELSNAGTISLTERIDSFGVMGHIPRILSSIKDHSMEGYANLIAKAAGTTRP